VLLVVMLGVMIAAIDTTIVVLGLPVMMADLHSDILSMVWVIMAYILALTVLGPQVGKFGDMFGRVRMYNLGFGVFTFGSVLCGLAQSGPELIGLRVLQGVGGALISANSGAIIADNVPANRRGRAFGLTGIGYNIGAIVGILLGGILITFVNWRFIFYINLPIGIIALVLARRVLRERSPRQRTAIDFLGMALLAASLLSILLALTNTAGRGWSTANGVLLAVGLFLLALFVMWEYRAPAPLIDLRLFRDRVLASALGAAFFQALGYFAVFFLVIMYLQGVRGLTPFVASLLVAPGYVVGAVVGPFSGRLADRIGARLPATVGLAFQIAGILVYSTLSLVSPPWIVVLGAALSGCGSGFFFSANSSAVMANAPRNAYGVASGLLRTIANIGMVGSFAVGLLSAAAAIPRDLAFAIFLGTSTLTPALGAAFVQGLHAALLVEIVPMSIALVLSALRGGESRGAVRELPVDAPRHRKQRR
jgi:EmrB/QacA subfamily drug resistance transporter